MKELLPPEEFWPIWNRLSKVTFDGDKRWIVLNPGLEEVRFQDVYSEWKRWVRRDNNVRFEYALRTVGGRYFGAAGQTAMTFFLMNGWRLKVDMNDYSVVHLVSAPQPKRPRQLTIIGNVFLDGGNNGSSIFAP